VIGDSDREDRFLMLHAALDGELDAAGVIEIDRLLASDPALAKEYERLKALRQAIHAQAPRESAPEALRARILAAAGSGDAQARHFTFARAFSKRPSWPAFAAAIAATIFVTTGLERLVSTTGLTDETMLAVVTSHMRGQISDHPVDVASSDRHTVKPWLAGKLPVDAMVVDLAPDGFELLGGRIDIVGGNPVPTLVYKRREHLISVTQLRPELVDYPAMPHRKTVDGYPVVIWKDDARAYAAVSNIDPAELDAFAAAFRKAAAKERGQTGATESEK
jgi:anti-sigma factor RsiW